MRETFVIAEAGVNHNGSLVMAKQLIDAAVAAKANAVKFQSFQAQHLLTRQAPYARYQHYHKAQTAYDMITDLTLSVDDHKELYQYAQQQNILFLSTPFDCHSLRMLMAVCNPSVIKISSGDITHAPLLFAAARTRKPILLSTGLSTLGDIEQALMILAFGYLATEGQYPSNHCDEVQAAYYSQAGQQVLQDKITLLHCTTAYPTKSQEANLVALDTLKFAFGLPVGYSDHTEGFAVALAAVARGASVIEKHVTLDRMLAGPDHAASLEPKDLVNLVAAIREIEVALGNGRKIPQPSEYENKIVVRRSLVALQPIRKGEPFTEDNLGVKRPAGGISGLYYWQWLGKLAQQDYCTDELI